MSLIDNVRAEIQSALGLTDAEVAALSVNDLLHRYWNSDFALGTTYDGSESGLTAASSSIMDNFRAVEINEGTDLDYLKDVTDT